MKVNETHHRGGIMDVIFRGQHLTIDEGFRKYAAEHLQKLARHLPMADHAIVDVRREAKGEEGRYVVQVTVSANGTFLRAEERNFDMMAAIDATADALDRQAKRFKERNVLRSERRVDKDHRLPEGVLPAGEEAPSLPPDVEIVGGRVVRLKQFPMKPMTEAEAIEQMELLGHDFFMFHDADRDDLALLYRRQDGDYGMIIRENA
jgi:putative sigma-54 modulation protein